MHAAGWAGAEGDGTWSGPGQQHAMDTCRVGFAVWVTSTSDCGVLVTQTAGRNPHRGSVTQTS